MSQASVTLNGREFHLCPLTLGDLRRLEPVLLGIEKPVSSGITSMLSLVPVIHASISKLHPEVALEELEAMLDLNNFAEALDRVLELSGLRRSVPPVVAGGLPGENQPATE